jgi:hypothetical protein
VEALQQAVAEPATRTEALEILRGLVERVVVRPAEIGFAVELVGEIAHMVALGAGRKNENAAREGTAVFARSLKVVAGNRKQRESRSRVKVPI